MDGTPVNFGLVHWINFGWGAETKEGETQLVHHPDEVWLRYSLSTSEPWKKVKYRKKNAPAAELPDQLYFDEPLPLKKAKVKDLQATATRFLPPHCRPFYASLRAESDRRGNGDGNDTDNLSE